MEIAALVASRGTPVTVVEVTDRPLAAALGPELANRIVDRHRAEGVDFRTGVTVSAFHGARSVEAVHLSDGTRLPAATVLVGVGTVPRSDLARNAGLRCGDGVLVNDEFTTSDPWVLAAGDVACWLPNPVDRIRVEHWEAAIAQGAAAGAQMAGAKPEEEVLPYFWSEQYDLLIQMYGRFAAGDTAVVRRDTADSDIVFWQRDGRVVAAAGINASRSLRAARPLIQSRAAITADALTDPTTNLRELARTTTGAPRQQAAASR